jgi:hypothetical protein
MCVALDMWQFDNLAFGAQTTARYITMHGRSCVQDGSSCIVTVGDIASYFTAHTIALDPSKTNLTLKSASATTDCHPVNVCNGNANQFPNSTDNGVNFDVTVTAYYAVANPISMFWPGASTVGASTFNLFATSRQRIVF